MADLDRETQATQSNRITGSDEANNAHVNPLEELSVNDTPQQGTSATLTLTTTAVELKVGASPLSGRKYIEMEALDKNIKWGYDSSCPFNLQKAKFYALPCGEDCTIFLKTTQGTSDIAIAEK